MAGDFLEIFFGDIIKAPIFSSVSIPDSLSNPGRLDVCTLYGVCNSICNMVSQVARLQTLQPFLRYFLCFHHSVSSLTLHLNPNNIKLSHPSDKNKIGICRERVYPQSVPSVVLPCPIPNPVISAPPPTPRRTNPNIAQKRRQGSCNSI